MSVTTVSSSMITDATILNADIGASAAIVQSKLAALASANMPSGSLVKTHFHYSTDSYTATSGYGSASGHDTVYTPALTSSTIYLLYICNVRNDATTGGINVKPIFGSETPVPPDNGSQLLAYHAHSSIQHSNQSFMCKVAWSGTIAEQAVKLQSKYYTAAGDRLGEMTILIFEVA